MGGLTKLPIRRLMVLITLGRFPTIVLTNFLGSGLSDNLPLVAVAAIFSVVILGLVVWQRERIMKYLKRGSTKNPLRIIPTNPPNPPSSLNKSNTYTTPAD